MQLRKWMLALSATFGLTVMAQSAQALTIAQIVQANPNFRFEDDSVEIQNVDVNGNGLLDIGDTLRGIAVFPTLVNLDTTGTVLLTPIAGNSTLSAVFEVEVVDKIDNGNGTFNYVFGVHAAFANGPDGLPGTPDDYPAGTMIAFYEDPVDNVIFGGPTCTSTAPGGNCEQNVTDGTLILAIGFDDALGDTEKDEAWLAFNSPEDPSSAENFSSSTVLGAFNFQLATLFSAIGDFENNKDVFFTVPGGDGKIAWLGSGSILGTSDLNTPYDVSDDTQVTAEAIPEPGTLGLMGVGLVALAGMARRRLRKAA